MTDITAQFALDIAHVDKRDIMLKFVDGKSRPVKAEGLGTAGSPWYRLLRLLFEKPHRPRRTRVPHNVALGPGVTGILGRWRSHCVGVSLLLVLKLPLPTIIALQLRPGNKAIHFDILATTTTTQTKAIERLQDKKVIFGKTGEVLCFS